MRTAPFPACWRRRCPTRSPSSCRSSPCPWRSPIRSCSSRNVRPSWCSWPPHGVRRRGFVDGRSVHAAHRAGCARALRAALAQRRLGGVGLRYVAVRPGAGIGVSGGGVSGVVLGAVPAGERGDDEREGKQHHASSRGSRDHRPGDLSGCRIIVLRTGAPGAVPTCGAQGGGGLGGGTGTGTAPGEGAQYGGERRYPPGGCGRGGRGGGFGGGGGRGFRRRGGRGRGFFRSRCRSRFRRPARPSRPARISRLSAGRSSRRPRARAPGRVLGGGPERRGGRGPERGSVCRARRRAGVLGVERGGRRAVRGMGRVGLPAGRRTAPSFRRSVSRSGAGVRRAAHRPRRRPEPVRPARIRLRRRGVHGQIHAERPGQQRQEALRPGGAHAVFPPGDGRLHAPGTAAEFLPRPWPARAVRTAAS